jgi:DNA polymerase III delta prime subunit
MNSILQRESISNEIKNILDSFETKCKSIHFKKGIYIYGSPGCGKTQFVMELLTSLDYDIVKYDAGDVRNKSLIDTITSNNISNRNVLHLMNGKIKKIAIIMDEIDGMNNGDKGGITSLIKLIRQKKTKKQKTENVTLNPIICIGNYYIDKKIKELMKVCNVFELKTPTTEQIDVILQRTIPAPLSLSLKTNILNYVQGDLLKLKFIINLYEKRPELLNEEILTAIFMLKSYNYDAKKITHSLINAPVSIEDHASFMNETDRTIVSLLYHENIIDPLQTIQREETQRCSGGGGAPPSTFDFYLKIMDNICYADYIDRITFQNQIWVFNEMSSLIKTFYNNYMYHKTFPSYSGKFQPPEVRFTKVLTKYSTEYNNQLFIYNFCQELNMDKRDVIAFFQELRLFYGKTFYNQTDKLNQVMEMFQTLNISKLDVKRMYRYLDKNVKVGAVSSCLSLKEDDDFDFDEELDFIEL